jgi:SAM-dependent methyltransferase
VDRASKADEKPQVPDFSPIAGLYARARPRYPAELFAHLAERVERKDLAWDCATGNGQAALGLVDHFERVIATDASAEQIGHATPHPRIDYRVAPPERSGLNDRSVDLVTVAAAVHWFDLAEFSSELRRVVRPGGVVAAWTYHAAHVEPPLDRVFERFYRDVVSPYFAPGARLVDERYETLALPGEPVETASFSMSADWSLDDLIAYVRSWSGTQRYMKERGEDPIARIADELEEVWGEPERVRTVRWPLYLKATRL